MGKEKKRSMPADDQETRSEGQLIDRLGELGWKPQGPRKDKGEDFLVQIWDDGVSSGLSFYVQLKSITNAEKRKPKRTPDVLRYRLDVKDIEHWDVQSVPVVLFVWDVETRRGYWETIPRIVEALDKDKKGWRNKDSVTVKVPEKNGTDDDGMRRLRWLLADEALEGKLGRQELSFALKFPPNSDGINALTAFQKALDWGEEVTFEGPGTPEIQEPALYRRLYGDRGPSQTVRMTMTPQPHPLTVPIRIEVRTPSGSIAIPYVELRVVKQGRKHLTLSNEHQNRPIVFIFSGNDDTGGRLDMRWIRWGHTVQEARETVDFYAAMQKPGSRICIYDANSGTLMVELPTQQTLQQSWEWMAESLEKLAYLDSYISKFGKLELNQGIGVQDQQAIAILYQACKYGKVRMRKRLGFTVAPNAEDLPSEGVNDIRIINPNETLHVLGVDIPLGRVRETIDSSIAFELAVRNAIAQARSAGKPVPVQLEDIDVTMEFLDWPPPAARLQDLAITQSGYFTLNQAFEAGFTSAAQLEIHERVERCAPGVYRFLLHPPSEREDLVVAWLQTEKKCVFSHDTALSLHELSDILPVRLHLTVPADWKPVDEMPLAAHVVVHRGSVESHEIDWMGPVPYTKPLRTLLDCIDDNLPPDILEQALSDAYRRGMVTPVEFQSLQARQAKSA